MRSEQTNAEGGLHVVWLHPDLDTSSSTGNSAPTVTDNSQSHDASAKEPNLTKDIRFIDAEGSNSSSADSENWADLSAENKNRKAVAQANGASGPASAGDGDAADGGADGDDPGSWSKGAELHSAGHCRPCHYINTKKGCTSGAECIFCHLSHARTRLRPSKSKRAVCKRRAGAVDSALVANDPDQLNSTVQMLTAQGDYMSAVVKSRLRQFEKATGDGDDPDGDASTKLSL